MREFEVHASEYKDLVLDLIQEDLTEMFFVDEDEIKEQGILGKMKKYKIIIQAEELENE